MRVDRVRRHLGTGWPLVATGLVGAAVEAVLVWRIGWVSELPAFAVLGAVGTVASALDLRTRRMPNALLLPSYVVVAGLLALASATGAGWWPLARGAIAMGLVGGYGLLVGLVFPGRYGMADAKLGGLLALALGWLGWSVLVTGVFAGWVLAALALVVQRMVGERRRGNPLPLGPWLCLGALVAVVVR